MKAKLCRLAFASILSTTTSATLLADADLRYQLATKLGNISPTLIFLGTSIFLLIPAFALISRLLIPRFSSLSHKRRIHWLAASISISVFLILVIPLSPPNPSADHRLEIVNNDQRNPLSKGNEIYLVGLNQVINRQRVPVVDFIQSGDWQTRQWPWIRWQRMPTFTNDPQAKLVWEGTLSHDIEIIFWSSPQAGIVQVIWDGRPQTIDLYAAPGQDLYLRLPVSSLSDRRITAFLYYPAFLLSLSLITLSIGLWLVEREAKLSTRLPQKREILLYALPCILVWSIYLLTFWPGIMSIDSVNQWRQAVNGVYSDEHPIFHTLNIRLLSRLWLTPAMVAISQIIALSLTTGWVLFCIRKIGVPRTITWLICIVFALYPPNGSLAITLLKDIPYSITMLILTVLLFKIGYSKGLWLASRMAWIILALVAALISLYRHNGFPIAFGTLAILLLVYRSYWRPIMTAITFSLLLLLSIRGALYFSLNPGPAFPQEMFIEHAIAKHVVTGTSFSSDELIFLNKFAPLDIRWDYYCDNANYLVAYPSNHFNSKLPLTDQPGRLTELFISATQREPSTTIDHYICSTNYVWQIKPGGNYGLFFLGYSQNNSDYKEWIHPLGLESGIEMKSKIPWLIPYLREVGHKLNYYASDILYRPALYLYILFTASLIAAIRSRTIVAILPTIPIVLNTFIIGLFATLGEFRYLYSTYLVCMLFSIPFLLYIQKSTPKK